MQYRKAFMRFIAGAACAFCISIGTRTIPAYALIRTLDLSVDTENIESYYPGAGIAFFPEIEIDDEDSDLLTFIVTGYSMADADPTLPRTLRFSIGASDEILDDDLSVHAHAVRASYVDSVSVTNDEASGRLLVYPFYRLTEPEAVIDFDTGNISWGEVPYAGRYEIVIEYGDSKSARMKTSSTTKNISSYIRSSGGTIAVAVRALAPTVDEDEREYLNIAPSEFSVALGSTFTPYTGDYEEEDIWALLGDYESAADISFVTVAGAGTATPAGAGSSSGLYSGRVAPYSEASAAPSRGYGTFERVSYKWRFLIDSVPYSGGWIIIDGCWYYFDADGYMLTGHVTDDGIDYYLEERVGESFGRLVSD